MIRTYNRAFCQMLKRYQDIYEVLSIFLNYALRPTKVTPVVVLIIEILACELCDSVIDRLKVELKREAFLSHGNCSFWDEIGITNEEHDGIKTLSRIKDMLIQKSDKGNLSILLTSLYHWHDTIKFRNIDINQKYLIPFGENP